jgi:hypothetical protein
VIETVHGPVPETERLPVPTVIPPQDEAVIVAKPGFPEVVICGAVQPAGTTIW